MPSIVTLRFPALLLGFGLSLSIPPSAAPAQEPADLLAEGPASLSPSHPDNHLPGGLRSPLTKPTLPAALRRIVQPWEPQRALVVALTPAFIANEPDALQVYLQLFRLAAPYLEILVIVPYDRPETQVQVVQLVSRQPSDASLRERIHFVPATNASVWARDYLPQYALGADGRLVMLDSGRIDFTSDPTQALKLFNSPDRNPTAAYYRQLQLVLSDDITPAFLASHLAGSYRYQLQLVRPPLALDGGDFITLDDDNVILSQSTLRYNGGQEDAVSRVIRDYFGLKHVHFLETLPGLTIDHLDFILLPASARTVLIAEPPPRMASPQVYDAILQDQVTQVLNDNRRYLEDAFPDKTLIPVPMPPIPRIPRSEILDQIRQQLLQELCNQYLIKWSDLTARPPDDPVLKDARLKFERALVAQFGQVDLDRDADLDRIAQVVLRAPLADLEARHVRYSVAYRTYLNALYLHNAEGRQAVIIPRYKPQSADEATILVAMEPRVLAAYKQAFPAADLLWLDCDAVVGSLGAVHCLTHTVPVWNGPPKTARQDPRPAVRASRP